MPSKNSKKRFEVQENESIGQCLDRMKREATRRSAERRSRFFGRKPEMGKSNGTDREKDCFSRSERIKPND
ncbi:hypothetical protein D479_03333 [Halobacillus sp. BAB-2008]|nr:hypothetical protein D479_03333 [Halobacillus sp. BAB-2008]